MRKIVLVLMTVSLGFVSCDSDHDNVGKAFPDKFPVTYQFYGYESKAASKVSPITLPYNEEYVFETNSTLIKTRVQEDGSEVSIEGKFTVNGSAPDQSIEIILNDGGITTSCSGGVTELLYVINSNQIVNRQNACDGLNFKYIKMNQ